MSSTKHSIVVLPFENLSGDAEQDFFSDGMTEEIIHALAKIPALSVISRKSSFYFKGKNVPLSEIVERLNVNSVLEGSIRFAGDKVRISAQLIDAAEDYSFWSESWDRKMDDIFKLQDEISLKIADKLREEFGHLTIQEHLVNPKGGLYKSYELALKARFYFNQWHPEAIKKSIDLFEAARALDESNVDVYTGLADAYGFMATTEFMPRIEAWQKSANYTYQAFRIDPENAAVHYQLANLEFFTACDFKKAYSHAAAAIKFQPGYPEAQQFMAFLHILRNDLDTGAKYLKNALDIDPLSPETLFYKAYLSYRRGHFEETVMEVDKLLADNPKNIPALMVKAYALLAQNKNDQTLDYIAGFPKDVIIPDEILGLKTLANLQKGSKEGASLLAELEKRAEDPIALQAHNYLFLAYANQERNDDAFNFFERAFQQNSSILLLSFTDPLIRNLDNDPRYQDLMESIYALPNKTDKSEGSKELLTASEAESLKLELEEYLHNESPFLNPDLSLRSLAAAINCHPNQLSWLLNKKFKKNFNSFINDFRIAYFKELVKSPSNSHISIIGLAYESGFNSKTVFNTYFKKTEGITPKAFLEANKA